VWNAYWDSSRRRVRLDGLASGLRRKQLRGFERLMARATSRFGSGAGSAVELGCAPGTFLALFHRAAPAWRLTGVEFSERGLERARQMLAEHRIEASLVHGDLRQFEPQEGFDIAMSFGLVEHFEDPVAILRDHCRLLRRGGLLLVTVPNLSNALYERMLRLFCPDVIDKHNLKLMEPTALSGAASAAGATVLDAGYLRGVPMLAHSLVRPDVAGWLYERSCQLWNTTATLFPLSDHLARSSVYVIGQKP